MRGRSWAIAGALVMALISCKRKDPALTLPPDAATDAAGASVAAAEQPTAARPVESAAPPVEDEVAPARPDAIAEGQALPCPTQLAAAKTGRPNPLLDRKPNVEAMIQAARDGHPRRVRMRFHNPLSSCWCPGFSPTDSDGAFTHAIFPKPLVDGTPFDSSSRYGATIYIMTGYYSGRMINEYERLRLQEGREPEREQGDMAMELEEKYPEFCVESWCAIADPTPAKHGFRLEDGPLQYKGELARMRSAGVPFCQGIAWQPIISDPTPSDAGD